MRVASSWRLLAASVATGWCSSALADLDVPTLSLEPGPVTTITWSTAPDATSYGLYRGTIAPSGFPPQYDHRCLATELPAAVAEDSGLPRPGEAFYYLVTGLARNEEQQIVAGSVGRDSAGRLRPEGPVTTCGQRLFVDPAAGGAGDGRTWADAFTTVNAAIHAHEAEARGLELWVRGTVSDRIEVPNRWEKRGYAILGGFAGTESRAWERSPADHPTRLSGIESHPLVRCGEGCALLLDGLELAGPSSPVRIYHSAYSRLEMRDVRSAAPVEFGAGNWGPWERGVLEIVDSEVAVPSGRALRVFAYEQWEAHVLLLRSRFSGGGDATIEIEAWAGQTKAVIDAEIESCRIEGSTHGIWADSWNFSSRYYGATIRLRLVSSVVLGSSGHSVRLDVRQQGEQFYEGAAPTTLDALLVGNTIHGGGGTGVACSASRETADPRAIARCRVELWDNLITGHAAYGVSETASAPGGEVSAQSLLVGNGFFDNGDAYLRNGSEVFATGDAVNACAGARDNFEADPLYADAPAGNLHLASGSTAIDRGHLDSPSPAVCDVDGDPRSLDGDGDGRAVPDVGADEVQGHR